MAFSRDFSITPQTLETFKTSAQQNTSTKEKPASPLLRLHAFSWSETADHGEEFPDLQSVDELESTCHGDVRIVFAPRDVPLPETVDGLSDLLQRYHIPDGFVTESLQGTSQSFAVRQASDGTVYVWFHLLCKDLAIADNKIVHGHTRNATLGGKQHDPTEALNHKNANFSWLKPGFVLKIRSPQSSPPRPSRARTSSSDATLASNAARAKVELLCFGAPVGLRDRFQALRSGITHDEIVQDPYILLEMVLGEIFHVMDRTGWAIADLFGATEIHTLSMAQKPGKAAKELSHDHFTGLHNLAKHTIYLRENCEAALATLDDLRDHHKSTLGDTPSPMQHSTRQALKYRKTLFQSTQRRLESLDARMSNIIQLSFHIVTQGDSRLMQSENQSMKTIAIMTLIFMPLSTVASVFGSQFMKLQEESPYHLTVSQDFWLLWVIAVPLTVVVMIIWRVWYLDARGRLVDEIHRDHKTHGYMGWKTLPDTMRRRLRHSTHTHSKV